MQTSVTFRHMEPSDALKQHVLDKLHRIRKFFPDPIRAQIVLSLERYLHKADIVITLHNGLSIKGKELTEDMYSAIDLVMEKIEKQVRRYKERLTNHRPAPGPELLVHHEVIAPLGEEADAAGEAAAERRAPAPAAEYQIVRSSKFFAKPMTVEEAIMQMNLLSNEFLVFTNAGTRDVNVVYKRSDGNYGLIETGRSAE